MTRERDPELEALLSPLRKSEPPETARRRWREAVGVESERVPSAALGWLRRPAQLAAAVAVGYVLGVVSYRELSKPPEGEPVATIQYVYDKTE